MFPLLRYDRLEFKMIYIHSDLYDNFTSKTFKMSVSKTKSFKYHPGVLKVKAT